MATAQVKCALNARAQRQQMGVNKVAHMDIISNTGAIRRGMVCAKNRNRPLSADGSLQNTGDEMGLGVVVFS